MLLATTSAHAQTAGGGLRYGTSVDGLVTAGGAALLLGSEALKGWLAPKSCGWCDRNPDGSDALDVPDAVVRTALRWKDTAAANVISNVSGFAIAPMASLGVCEAAAAADNRSREAPANALVIVETALVAADLDQVVKFVVARQRPFAHFRDPAVGAPHDPDENLSFYSGHTSLDFSLAVASGTLASMRGYRLAPAVWASSLPVAFLTAYLRIAADKHYFTDVLTGAVLGSAVGFLVPFVFHRAPRSLPSPADAESSDATALAKRPLASTGGPFLAGSWSF